MKRLIIILIASFIAICTYSQSAIVSGGGNATGGGTISCDKNTTNQI